MINISKSALYVRVSTHYQIDKDSLPFQKKELINYSKFVLNINDYEIFEDAGYSGKNTERPAFQDMMNRIKQGEFTHLLVWKIDRISRNLLDFCAMYEKLKTYQCTFVSKNEQFDTSSAMGEAMLKIILVFAELERKLTAERVSSVMLSRAEKGLWNGAPCPLGYRWSTKKKYPVIDENEAHIIHLIYDNYEELKSSLQVAKFLNKNLVKTKRNGVWSSKTVSDIIRNPFYKGTYRYNYRETAHGKIKDKSEWIVLENNHHSIISKDQWNICNKIMDTNAERNTALYRKKSRIHIFARIIKCKKCGNTFTANIDQIRKDGYRPSFYYCMGKYKAVPGCNAELISDITLGPFIMNYIANLLKAQQNLKKNNNLRDLEKMLLSGKPFKNVYGIYREGLEKIYLSILYYNNNSILVDKPGNDIKTKNSISEIDALSKDKSKYERAIERLQNLYLFSEESMPEKTFLVQKLKLKNKLDEIETKIKKLRDDNTQKIAHSDILFLKTASHFMLENQLLNKKFINFKTMHMTMDKQLIKNFIDDIIERIIVEDGKIETIYFKNGIISQFIYRDI